MTAINHGRRRLLRAGLLGGLLLAGYGGYRVLRGAPAPLLPDGRFGTPATRDLWRAAAGAVLDGALPEGAARAPALDEVVDGIEYAHRHLPPGVRGPLAQLYGLMTGPLTRGPLTGVWREWSAAGTGEVAAFLLDWSQSRLALKRSAYGAFHDLSIGTWYGNPKSWTRIGYAGPPFEVRA